MSVRDRIGLLGPVLGWMLLILAVSSQSTLPSLDIGWLDRAAKAASHFGEYAILAFLMARIPLATRPRLTTRSALMIVALCFVYSLSDEFHQRFVPGRVADWADVAADTVGAATAVALLRRARLIHLLRRVDPLL